MRIFTKSLFTLLLLCVAGVVNAQDAVKGWFELDLEATSVEAENGADGGARITHASRMTSDGAYVIYCRDKETALAQGDMAVGSGEDNTDISNYKDWDTQFFLCFGKDNALPENTKFRLRMKVKADEGVTGIATQAHGAPGSYNHYECVGNVDFTDDWTDFDSGEKTVSSSMVGNNTFYTIAFNLGKGTANTYYFKDIIFEVYGDKPATPTLVSTNFKWTDLINNGDAEGEDVSNFYLRTYPYDDGVIAPHAVIEDGAGVDGSRAVKAASVDKQKNVWDTQFWIACNETLPAGTRIKVEFDYRADADAKTSTQAHMINPGEGDGGGSYITSSMIGDINFTTEWQKFSNDNVTISNDMSTEAKPFGSITFNMNEVDAANVYYFDNIVVQKGSLLNDVKNDEAGGFRILFTEYTNMPDVVKNVVGKKKRVVLTGDAASAIVKILVNDAEAPVESVEFDREGALYAFLNEDYVLPEDAKIVVKFTNSTDAKYQLLYTRGENINNPVEDFELESVFDGEIDIIPNSWLSPELESSEPENGSFNLNSDDLAMITVTFDKPVKVKDGKTAVMKAVMDENEELTIMQIDPENLAQVTLMRRPGAAALAAGEHTVTITNVFSVNDDAMYEDSPATLTFSIGEKAMNAKLQRAIASAQAVLEDSEGDDRYQGAAYTALKSAVTKYETEGVNYTAPSQVQAALDDLSIKTETQKQHFNLCKSYDDNLASAEELVDNYGESKFAVHPLYAELATAVGKYHGKVLTDDTQLSNAIKDLESNVKTAQNMFTEGPSKNQDSGVKVLVERIRLGAETLKENFGVAEDDELIVAANNALTDDDDLAKALKNAVTAKLYEKLAAGNDAMFSETEDEEGNITKKGPDMTVFVKNPNYYAKNGGHKGFNAENVPGWVSNVENNPGLWTAWSGGARNIDGLPEDCAITTWYGNFYVEQTITDLPAGVYNITIYGSEWLNNGGGDEPKEINSFVYAKTSDTPVVEEGAEEDRDVNFAATTTVAFAGSNSMSGAQTLSEVTVTDGKLTFGINMKGDSQYFFSNVELTLVGPAEGVNYSSLLEDFQTGVKNVKTVNAAVYFDLQGRRVAKPTKGLYIKNNQKVVIK